MNHLTHNSGIATFGGTTHVTGSAVGDGASVNVSAPSPRPSPSDRADAGQWHIGVVTVLAEEMKAVLDIFRLNEDQGSAGEQRFYTGTMHAPGRTLTMVATRTLAPGQRSVMATLAHLQHSYHPSALVLVGLGGGIHPGININDVVVATSVVYYDLRKVTPQGVLHRGQELHSPAMMVHTVNSFFTHHGQPAELHTNETGQFRVHAGTIGTGDAVIADRNTEIRRYLSTFNEKILAVDTESGGLGQYCYETHISPRNTPNWIAVRGISDHADHTKNDNNHQSAATNAAHTLSALLPYIRADMLPESNNDLRTDMPPSRDH
jgi:adenosylhomocysteine nucleosidase